MERLKRLENRLKEIQGKPDKEPYRDEVMQIRGIVNSYESDGVKVGFESSRTLEHNIEVSLEGIGAIKDAIVNTIKRLWEAIFGSRSSGGSGSDKVEEVANKAKKDVDEMKKKVKDAEEEHNRRLKRIKDLGESGIPGAYSNGFNLNVNGYTFDIKNKEKQITNNNPKNKIIDVYANELLNHILVKYPLLFALIGKSNVTLKNFKEGLKKLGSQKQDAIWKEYQDYIDEKDNFTNREHNELHKFIKRAEELFGKELMPDESPISIDIVGLTGTKLGILYINKHSKEKGIDKDLTFHYGEFGVANSYIETLKITDNTITEDDIVEINKLISNITFFDTDPIEKIIKNIEKDKKRFKDNLGYPKYQVSVLKMGQTLQSVMSRMNYNKSIFNASTSNLANNFTTYIEKTEDFRMGTLKKSKPSLYDRMQVWLTTGKKPSAVLKDKEEPIII